MLASMARRGFTASAGPESPRYYAPSPYGVVRPHHLGVFVTLRAIMISLLLHGTVAAIRLSHVTGCHARGFKLYVLHVLVRAPV